MVRKWSGLPDCRDNAAFCGFDFASGHRNRILRIFNHAWSLTCSESFRLRTKWLKKHVKAQKYESSWHARWSGDFRKVTDRLRRIECTQKVCFNWTRSRLRVPSVSSFALGCWNAFSVGFLSQIYEWLWNILLRQACTHVTLPPPKHEAFV